MATETIDVTPNYEALFAHFSRDLDAYGKGLLKRPSRATLHAWLGPFTIALQSATTAADLEALRVHTSDLLRDLAALRAK